jgi:cytochrome c556
MMPRLGLGTALVVVLLPLAAQRSPAQSDEYKLAQVVLARQTLMGEMHEAYWVLLEVHQGESADFASAAKAASSMGDKLDAFLRLMEPGTARGEAIGSRAKPEVWSDAPAFAEAAEAFRSEAAALSEAAARGDADAYGQAFEAFTTACTACHEFRPSRGGRFRFAIDE